MTTRTATDRHSHLVGTWVVGDFAFRRCWRNTGDDVSLAALTVCPASPQPNPSTLERLAHNYGLRDELDGSWALRPIGPRWYSKIRAASPSSGCSARPWRWVAFLRLAVGVTGAWGDVGKCE
jgi:hypothetical protein